MQSPLDILLLLAAFLTFGAYVCRLDALHWREHRPAVVGLHVALAIAVAWAGIQGWRGQATPGDWSAVAAAILWLATSWRPDRRGIQTRR